ncbi:hypothetical protein [Haladaptatus sp. DFWS20]|uniref:hypothetical protein n=1 Tax=Haladaptatus sp. DFWS20 TaxID=3403467 RepID=UPI003EB912D8
MLSTETTDEETTGQHRNALLAWVLVTTMVIAVLASAFRGDYLWVGFGITSILLALIPVFVFRRPTAMVPWESLLAVALGLISVPLGSLLPRSVATFVAVAGLALVLAVEFDAFTAVELSPLFAVLFVVVATMASAGVWAVVQWVADSVLGTQNLRSLTNMMWSLFAATVAGVVAGLLFTAYFRRIDTARFGFGSEDGRKRGAETTAVGATEGWGLSETRQRQVVRGFQLALVGVLLYGLYEVNVGIIVNTAVALALTELPALLERNYGLPMDTRLTLWIVVPVFLHAIGTVGLYQSIGLWDQLTHALSSSLVAAAGYTVVRALDVHADSIYLPKEFMFVFILLFTLAFGVLWELLEFGLDGVASMTGTQSVLAQYSLGNTMLDLVFDTIGGVVVALWGARYLSHVADTLASDTFQS